MSRAARVVIPGCAHHVTQRGNDRQDVFFTDDDATGLLAMAKWRKRLAPGGDWRDAISRPQDKAIAERLRTWGNRGCPLGSDRFISKLETALNRRMRAARVRRRGGRRA